MFTLETKTSNAVTTTVTPAASEGAPGTPDGREIVNIVGDSTSAAVSASASSIAANDGLADISLWILGGTGATNGVSATFPIVQPGGNYKIYDANANTGERDLVTTTFSFGGITDEQLQFKLSGKPALVTWMGPIKPTYNESAGVKFKFVRQTRDQLEGKMRKALK